jgi:hypothetical protein
MPRVCCLLLCLLLAGCDRKVLSEVLLDSVDVVQEPFPPGYPSSNPVKNRVIATLRRVERLHVGEEDYGKDYAYYAVKLLSGQKGYVIFTSRRMFRRVDSN